jgi:hypothetical protein
LESHAGCSESVSEFQTEKEAEVADTQISKVAPIPVPLLK